MRAFELFEITWGNTQKFSSCPLRFTKCASKLISQRENRWEKVESRSIQAKSQSSDLRSYSTLYFPPSTLYFPSSTFHFPSSTFHFLLSAKPAHAGSVHSVVRLLHFASRSPNRVVFRVARGSQNFGDLNMPVWHRYTFVQAVGFESSSGI